MAYLGYKSIDSYWNLPIFVILLEGDGRTIKSIKKTCQRFAKDKYEIMSEAQLKKANLIKVNKGSWTIGAVKIKDFYDKALAEAQKDRVIDGQFISGWERYHFTKSMLDSALKENENALTPVTVKERGK